MKPGLSLRLCALSGIWILAAFFFFRSAHAEGPPLVKIGAILPLSGDMSMVGEASRDAIRLAIEDFASDTRFRYQLVFEDDKLTPKEVATAAQKLISVDKVSAILSTWSYGGQIVSPLAKRAKIPHIGVAWDHSIADGQFNFLHLTPPSEFMKRFLDAFKKLGVHRVALLGIEESGSVFALDEFVRLAPSYDVEVVYRESVLWDLRDFNSIVSKISATKPDYLLFNLGGQSMLLALLHSLETQHVGFKITAITGFDVLDDTSRIEGLWYVSDSMLPENFARRFKDRYGHSIRYGIGNFYEAIRLLISAFEKTRDASPKAASAFLAQVQHAPSIFGETSVSAQGIFTYPASYIRVKDGLRQLISIDDITE